MAPPDRKDHPGNCLRAWAYLLVALVALLVGYVLGLLGGQPPGGSRVDWPGPNPRALSH